jgi:hypothetical protein
MPIDSRAKRASVAGMLSFLPPGVTNDATPDQAWRQAVGFGYFGILADEAAPIDVPQPSVIDAIGGYGLILDGIGSV